MAKEDKKTPGSKGSVRKKYTSPSKNFVSWVNSLGIEKTWLGKWIHYLDENFSVRRVSQIFLFCFVIVVIAYFEYSPTQISYQQGDISPVDIKAPFDFEFNDYVETANQKQIAESTVPPIFDFKSDEYDILFQRLDRAFRTMRVELAKEDIPNSETEFDRFAQGFLKHKKNFENILQIRNIPESLFIWLTKKRFSSIYLNYLYRLLEPLSESKIISDLKPLKRSTVDDILVRNLESGQDKEHIVRDEKKLSPNNLIDISQAKSIIMKSKSDIFKSMPISDRRALKRLAANLVIPNLSQNIEETTSRRQAVREAVPSALVQVKKGQIIIPEGSTVEEKQLIILNEIRKIQTQKDKDFIYLVSALFLTILAIVLLSFLKRFTINTVKITNKDMLVMGIVTLLTVLTMKVIIFLTDVTTFRELGFFVPDKFFLYITPVAAATMIIGLLFTRGETIWLFSLFLAAVLAIVAKFDFNFFIFVIIGSIAAARGVFHSKKRNDVYLAGLRVGAVNFLVIACLTWLTSKDQSFQQLLWFASAGFLSGIFSAMVAMMLVPLFESVFNYTTDVRLMELSNLNHPLLKEMLLKAPGTYHHSVIVGTMAESAAEEIGANPLLSKVGAFFHDIGKIHHAEYFAENQRPGYNPHDNISPHMSKTILIAHVKDGAELSMQYNLGKPITDIILQHHGTTLISYFYNKAKENEDDIHKVSPEEFRYPGPKPQFKEAGLVMIADSIEAAARSLEEPTAARLQNIVKNIIQNKFLDGQLENCNLTLKDLSIIEDVYERILLTIYHQRIDYPKSMGGVDTESTTPLLNIKGK